MVPFRISTMARPRARTLPLLPFLLVPLAVAAPLSRAQAADVTITEEARTRFSAGVNLLKDPEGPRYEEAYREFKAAYAASPSYKILGNLGLCAMKLERDEEAIAAYEKYLAEGKDLDPAEVAQVKTDLHTLKAGVVYLTLASNPPGAKIVDVRSPVRGERVTNTYGPTTATPLRIGIRQGQHVITAKLEGYPDAVWEIETGSTELPLHTFELKKPEVTGPAPVAVTTPVKVETTPIATRPVPTTVWIGVAATGAFTVGAVVTGILASSKRSDFDAKNDGSDPAAAQSLKDSGETLNLVNDVLVGGAVVAAGVTAVLYLTRPTVNEERPLAPGAGARIRVTPTVAARGSGGGLSVLGSF
jgi:hypothetical protein